MEQFLLYVEKLYSNFGWWALLIVAVVTALMIPTNIGVKALFNLAVSSTEKSTKLEESVKTTRIQQIERIRKVVSSLVVFVIAIVVLYLFEWIFGSKNYNFSYIISASLPTGICSMFVWALIKAIKDIGIVPVITKIAETLETSGYLSKLLASIDMDETTKKIIYEFIKDKVNKYANGDSAKVEEYLSSTSLANDVGNLIKLNGITTNIASIAQQFIEIAKSKLITTKKTEETNNAN